MSEDEPQSEGMKALEKSLRDHMEICYLKRKAKRLKAENLKLKKENARLCKAGDAMEVSLLANFNGCPYEPIVIMEVMRRWRDATEGKQP